MARGLILVKAAYDADAADPASRLSCSHIEPTSEENEHGS
jgi:hypothetical protein